jgi:hypothetical protein
MMRMGPEALMVVAKTAPRAGLEMYARAQFVREDAQRIEASLRAEREEIPVRYPPLRRLQRAVQGWLGHGVSRSGARRPGVETEPELRARDDPVAGLTLAALPVSHARFGPERRGASLAAAPIYTHR